MNKHLNNLSPLKIVIHVAFFNHYLSYIRFLKVESMSKLGNFKIEDAPAQPSPAPRSIKNKICHINPLQGATNLAVSRSAARLPAV